MPDVRKFLTPIRAMQMVATLLKANNDPRDTMHGVLGNEENPASYAAAVGMLRDIAAKEILRK